MSGIQSKVGVPTEDYLISEGVAGIASLDTSTELRTSGFKNLGSLTEVSFAHTFTELEVRETMTGQGNVAANLITDKEVEVTLTFKNFSVENYELLTLGNITTQAAQVAKAHSEAYTVEELYMFDEGDLIDVATLVVKDSGDTITYEEGKNYDIDSGNIWIYSEADQTAKGALNNITSGDTLNLTYNTLDYSDIQAFQNNSIEKYFQFNAINKITGENVLVRVPKLSINPSDAIPFLSPDAEGTATITAKALTSKGYAAIAPYSVSKI